MKRRIALLLAGVCTVSLLAAGCSGSKEASNDYVTVSGYKGIEVDKVESEEVTDDSIDSYISSMLEQNATEEEITGRAVEDGDTVNIDYVGKIDGEAFEGGSAEGQSLVIGSGSFIDGFEDSVIGHEIGETYDWNGKFPDPYTNNTELSGKDVVFTITVNAITKSVPAELTDDFVKTVSEESKTVDEYKAEVKKTLEKSATDNQDSSLQEAAWNAVLEKAEVKKYPDGEVDEVAEQLIQQYKDIADSYGMEYEDLITQQAGMEVDEFEKKAKEAAESSVKQKLVAELIAEKEKLTPSDEELKKEYEKMAEQYGYEDVDAMKEVADEDTLKTIVIQNIVKEWIADNCVQVEAKDSDKDDAAEGSDEDSSSDAGAGTTEE